MTSDPKSRQPRASLKEELRAALPQGFECKVRYVHTRPKRCDPLFSPPPGQEAERTRLASHFLAVSTEDANGALVYAVEALVYTTKRLTTIFVSKADSTGYLPQRRPSPVKLITSTFLTWLSNGEREKHPTRKLVISLFARSQSQYLFPGSAENARKHVLDDRQLVKWWARVLDPLVRANQRDSTTCDGYVTIPGFERSELRPYFPPSTTPSTTGSNWHSGHPLIELAESRGVSGDAPPRCLIPRFPDDPKARFMQDLDDEAGIVEDPSTSNSPSKRRGGRWTSVRDLATFWETMAFRQECSSGRLVGFLWVLISPTKCYEAPSAQDNGVEDASQESAHSGGSEIPSSEGKLLSSTQNEPSKKRRRPLTGPILPRQPRLKGGSSSLTASDLSGMLGVDTDSGGVVLTQEGYDKVMHTLLHLDFANLDVAAQSTKKWIAEISQTCGVQGDWGLDILGSAQVDSTIDSMKTNGASAVNDLGGMIRKKRKADDAAQASEAVDQAKMDSSASGKQESVNLLGGAMIRKKPKPAA